MKIKELIEMLSKFDKNGDVTIEHTLNLKNERNPRFFLLEVTDVHESESLKGMAILETNWDVNKEW